MDQQDFPACVHQSAHFGAGCVVLLWIKIVLDPVFLVRDVSVFTSRRRDGLLKGGWTFVIGEVKLHESYLITAP